MQKTDGRSSSKCCISMIKRYQNKRETACVGPQSIASENVCLEGHCAVSMEKMEFIKAGFKPEKC